MACTVRSYLHFFCSCFFKNIFAHDPTEYDYYLKWSNWPIDRILKDNIILGHTAQSACTAEYTDGISADSSNECPGYDTKQSDAEAP